ncbi:MAG: metal ABC transporter substrate-binding protein [Sulfurimonas sp.]|nr:metal ABC transporter substrate-binding protein [Sulfurimonas sp.]MDQ7060544.1 metal ABC transporter substrate-binding protein [Sulfurimonas sp.]
MVKNYKYIIAIVILTLLIVWTFILNDDKDEKTNSKESKKIVSLSTFVLHDIAKHIVGDTLELVKIIPNGVDVHSFEPTPKIMAKVEKSALVIYNGAGLEPWLSSFNFKGKAIGIAKFIKLKHLNKDHAKEHEHHGHTCSHSSFDPHFWLDVENMKDAANIMTYEFIRLEPKHKLLYLGNRNKYTQMLDSLDAAYKKGLKNCELNTIITNHNAFSYLSDKYDFNVSALKGLSPDAQSAPKDMIRIIEAIEKYKTPVVFFEDFSNAKSMQTLARQANVKIDSLHTLGNVTKDDVEHKRTYEDIMLSNLEKITKALVCQ